MNSSRAKRMKSFSTSVVLMSLSALFYMNCSRGGFSTNGLDGSANLASSEPSAVSVIFTKVPLNMVNANSISFSYDISGQNISSVSAKCYLDQTLQSDCSSPIDLTSLPDGDYTLTVDATNQNSLVLATAKRSFRLDRRAPVLTINSAPSGTINTASASISFSVVDNFPGVVVSCSLDSAAFASCSSPYSMSNLAQGSHSIKIFAQDAAGNKSATQTISFSVNTAIAIPTVAISQMPAAFSNSASASFSFAGASTGSTIASYQCSLDNSAFAACTSPQAYSSLAEGSHSFAVKAVDASGQSSSAANYSFSVDVTKPSTPSVSSDQMNPTKSVSLNLTFMSTDSSGVTKYECKLDSGSYAGCVSPQAFSSLSSASHTFTVRATDKAGNVSAEGSYAIVVDNVAPVVTISSQPASSTQSTSASFSFTVSDALSGVNLVECQLDTLAYANCSSPQAYSNLAVGTHNFNLRGTDKAGNSSIQSYSWSVAAAATPTPTATPVPPSSLGLIPNDVFDANGNVIPSAYVALANQWGSDAAIAYRFGNSYSYYHSGAQNAPTWYYPGDHTFYPHGNSCFQADFPSFAPDQSLVINYQVGALNCSQGDYGSNMGTALYNADAASDPGVTTLITQTFNYGTTAEKPQVPWVYYMPQTQSPATDPYLGMYYKSVNGGVMPSKPIIQGRCSDHWCQQALVGFQNGLIVSLGDNTASNAASLKLPAGKVPTSIAITNNGEFALVTIWDAVNIKGQVAVIALGSLCQGCTLATPGANVDGVYREWNSLLPGFRNRANFVFMKLLGFVDLPGMVAPVGVSAVSDYGVMEDPGQGWLYNSAGQYGVSPGQVSPADSVANQQTFVLPNGLNSHSISRSGIAAVFSKSEKKVIFLNLKPLFDKMNNTYFGAFTTLQNAVATTGLADSQWPPVFSVQNYAPTVITTLSYPAIPTSVRISILPNMGQAWIGTEDGVIHSVAVSGWQAGTDTNPANIKEVGSIQLGKNPTSIAHRVLDYRTSTNEIWVLSRGDRRVDLVDMKTMTIEKTLYDSRMVDPITVDEARQNPGATFLITIADYAGKQIMNYRYQPIVLHGANAVQTWGMGATGTDPFEFGGSYTLPGKPFQFTQSNVP